MAFTIQKLANMAGISTRTLRYYDELGLLVPMRINASGYRIYGQNEIDILQHILFYREMGFELLNIKSIITNPDFNAFEALEEHHKQLLDRKIKLEHLILNVEKTMASHRGGSIMSDKEKFEGFKRKMIDDNANKYGKEIREKYGNDTIDKSNQKVSGLSEEDLKIAAQLAEDILEKLSIAMASGDPEGPIAQEIADMHKRWLNFFWQSYSKEAHVGLAQMYVDDSRFTAYYDDKIGKGTAEFLRDAILYFTGQNHIDKQK